MRQFDFNEVRSYPSRPRWVTLAIPRLLADEHTRQRAYRARPTRSRRRPPAAQESAGSGQLGDRLRGGVEHIGRHRIAQALAGPG
ncbi:hypothetical protein ACWCO9_28880 [Streptomyces sp. NPDC001937]